MGRIKILDCTLRDGGYVNNWEFGFNNIKKTISGLIDSGIAFIECGFLTEKKPHNNENSLFNKIEQFDDVVPKNHSRNTFACMVNHGEYDLSNLPPFRNTTIQSVRYAFHKKDMHAAIKACYGIKEKGYQLFLQPMVSMSYSDAEFIELINFANELMPFAFYIVDSFGVMKNKDLIRLFYMVDHNLSKGIKIGYHSHNNMQLAYSNACALSDVHTDRDVIIDTSVFGMGRGAGNLNTELFLEHLNDVYNTQYKVKPLLKIIDEVLNPIYHTNYWGYSLEYYLSASHNCHPSYSSYLEAKKTLLVNNVDEILAMLDPKKKNNFDQSYIEELYVSYLAARTGGDGHISKLKETINGRDVLLIAPGRSSTDEKEKVIAISKLPKTVTISVNFAYNFIDTDYIFVSNLRRFNELDISEYNKTIITSNIDSNEFYVKIPYQTLLNDIDPVRDNAGLMLIRFLIDIGIKKIYIAGLDGYTSDTVHNYINKKIAADSKMDNFEETNKGIAQVLNKYSREVELDFVTTSRFKEFV